MRRRCPLLLLLAAALLSAACQSPSKEPEAVLFPVPDDPTITFKVWFKVGSQDDPPGKEGLAALTAQMLSEAGTTRNSYDAILEKLYPLASSYRTDVDREMTVLTGRTHRDNLETYLGLFSDAWLRPGFAEEDFERLRTDALNYLENTLRYASDEELGKAALYAFVFEGTRYAHPVIGTVAGLRSITLDDVRAFHREHFTRDNAVLALGGGYDEALARRFQDLAHELAPRTLASDPEIAYTGPPPVAPPIDGVEVLLVHKPDADTSISFGFPIDVRRGEREFYALWLANSWLGEHRNSSSHLYQVIREARGLNYGDYSYIEAFTNGGGRSMPPTHVGRRRQLFEVWIRTLPNHQAHFSLRAALREVSTLIERGMTEEQFALTRAFLKKYTLHFAETTTDRLGYAVDDRFYGIAGESHLTRFQRVLDELTLDEVNATIRKHLKLDRVKVAMVTGDAEGLKGALVSGRPSPIEYDSPRGAGVAEEDAAIAVFPLRVAADAVRVIPVERVFE